MRRICTWCLRLLVPSRYWRKGNTQYVRVWKHALLSHFGFQFCGCEFLETKPVSPIFCSPQGLGNSHSFKQRPSFNSELPFSPMCACSCSTDWGCVLCVSLDKAQEGAASDMRRPGHLCGRLPVPPLELRKCMLVPIPGGHCRAERNTAAPTQPTPDRCIEKIFLNYLWRILLGTASKSSSWVHILSSVKDGRRGLFHSGGEAHKGADDSSVFVSSPWVVQEAGACVEAGRVERALHSSKFHCSDCSGGSRVWYPCRRWPEHFTQSAHFPPDPKRLLWPQSPLDRPFCCGYMSEMIHPCLMAQ